MDFLATYQIEVKNTSKKDAVNYQVEDKNSENLEFSKIDGANYKAGDVPIITFDTVKAGKTAKATVTYKIKDTSKKIINAAKPTEDWDTEENFELSKIRIKSFEDASEEEGVLNVGDEIYYAVTFTNNSKATIENKTVEDIPVDGIALLEVKTENGSAKIEGKQGIWTVEKVEAGQSATLLVRAKYASEVKDGYVDNKAQCGNKSVVASDPVYQAKTTTLPQTGDTLFLILLLLGVGVLSAVFIKIKSYRRAAGLPE